MNECSLEENALMGKIIKEHGPAIKAAVLKFSCGYPDNEDILIEIYFALVLALRRYGIDWTPSRSFIFGVIRNKVNDFLREKYKDKEKIEAAKKQINEDTETKEELQIKVDFLTHREFQVFRFLGLGMKNSEISQDFFISEETVKSHVRKIRIKCGIKDRARLCLLAHQICYKEKEKWLWNIQSA